MRSSRTVVLNRGDTGPACKSDTKSQPRQKEKTRLCGEHGFSALANIKTKIAEDPQKPQKKIRESIFPQSTLEYSNFVKATTRVEFLIGFIRFIQFSIIHSFFSKTICQFKVSLFVERCNSK